MGWREATQAAAENATFMTDEGGYAIGKHSLAQQLLTMPDADRIALARELLAGTGRVVARDVGRSVYKSSTEYDDGNRNGWNACRAAMLADPDA